MNNMEQRTNDKKELTCNGNSRARGEPRLSLRLKAVADFVNPGSRIADIGTDHGYVPIYLARTGRVSSAIAMDVREGPLKRAREHIREYEAGEYEAGEHKDARPGKGTRPACPIEARLSDGMKELMPGEADTIILAGMGGELEMRILDQGRHMWDSVDHFILSPQSELGKVRLYLEQNGFAIQDESMVKDEGKYYTIMSVTRGSMEYGRQIWYRFGKILIERKDRTLREYLEKESGRVQEILDTFQGRTMETMTEGQAQAIKDLRRELDLIKEAQDEMQ